MKPSEAAELVAVLMAAYPSAKSTPRTSEVYERMLMDLDVRAANAAVERLLATSRFMPTVAEIREACMDLMHGDRKAGGEAWGECLQSISRFGVYRVPGQDFVFQDPVIDRVVRALGWTNLCSSENQAADRARFIELYDQLAIGARKQINAGQLPAAQKYNALKSAEDNPAMAAVLSLAAAKRLKS